MLDGIEKSKKRMKTLMKNVLVALFFVLGISAIPVQSFSQSNARVVGSVSGEIIAGEMYELYKSSADSFRDYLAGWQHVGPRDKTINYSYSELYEKCLEEARRQYRNYSNLSLDDFDYKIEYEELNDERYYTNVVGSSTEYKKKDRQQKVYIYSAIVVVNE